jgi:hypothetical protein
VGSHAPPRCTQTCLTYCTQPALPPRRQFAPELTEQILLDELQSFELILPFLRPIEPLLLDESISEIMGNPGYPVARPEDVAVQTSVPPTRFPTNQPADVQRTWQSHPLSGGSPAAISRWPKSSSPPPERSDSYHQGPMPIPRAGQNQNRIQPPPPTGLNSRLPRPRQTSFPAVHNSASEWRSASPAVKPAKPKNR